MDVRDLVRSVWSGLARDVPCGLQKALTSDASVPGQEKSGGVRIRTGLVDGTEDWSGPLLHSMWMKLE